MKDTDFKKLAEISSLVMILPSSIAVGLVIGYFLDRWLKTGSWMLLLWLVLGIVSGLLNVFRGIRQYFEKNQTTGRSPEKRVDSGKFGG
ncbi:MAG TPA: magnesium transporter [Acidobacteria bacterium]|nr:magnesium transporter [Acidobacteriota bacterium]